MNATTDPRFVEVYDTTLRDGSQGEGISFSLADKLKITRRLDAFGVAYIEGGWPGSNPKDIEFFERARDLELKTARLAAFGSTRRAKTTPEEDAILTQLLRAETPVITIFGKSWTLHVTEVLRATLDQNLEMIRDSVAWLKSNGREVVFDAEHFFDGYRADSAYAMACLEAAEAGGADRIVLCDTNGGSMPWDVEAIVREAVSRLKTPVGIHPHNDCDLGVANAVAAVRAGATHVQGTMNGIGERTGNANLASIIPVLELKLGRRCLPEGNLTQLVEVSHFVDEIANLIPNERQPFVGRNAFAHKAGVHVDALTKAAGSYEHTAPETVGNVRRVLLSELSGGATLEVKAREWGVELVKNAPQTRALLARLAEMEHEGYVFEDAEASFELLVRRSLTSIPPLFELLGYRAIVEKRDHTSVIEATVKLRVKGKEILTVSEGDGPVDALDGALRQALLPFYPELESLRLTDYKVRVVNGQDATAAKVRVHVETSDGTDLYSTIGVSENIVEASWNALVDAVEFGLLRRHWTRPASGTAATLGGNK
jgi:2-isopropylmalate synthase